MEYHATPDRLRRPASSLRTIVCPAMRSVKYVETAGKLHYLALSVSHSCHASRQPRADWV